MSFTQDDATLLVSLVTFVFWQMSSRSSSSGQSGQNRKWYDRNRQQVTGGFVPGIVFPFIWTILYGLIVASFYIFIKEYQETRFYITVVVLFIVNILLNKLWSVFFFDNEDTFSSLIVAVGMFLSGIAIVVLQGMDDAYTSMGLFVPYVAWVGFAVFLNFQWHKRGLPTVTDGHQRKEQIEDAGILPGPNGVTQPTNAHLGNPNIFSHYTSSSNASMRNRQMHPQQQSTANTASTPHSPFIPSMQKQQRSHEPHPGQNFHSVQKAHQPQHYGQGVASFMQNKPTPQRGRTVQSTTPGIPSYHKLNG